MQVSIEQLLPEDPDWQQLCGVLKAKVTLSAQVLVAWQMGVWLARTILEQQRSTTSMESGKRLPGWQPQSYTATMVCTSASSTPAWLH